MAWKDIYDSDSKYSSFLAKVPSNSVYYSDPDRLIRLNRYLGLDQYPDGVMFGRGYLYYKNESAFERVSITSHFVDESTGGPKNCSVEIRLDHVKRTKMFECSVRPSFNSVNADNYIREHISCPMTVSVKSYYASDVMDDLTVCIKDVLLETQKAYYDYLKRYQNDTLEFEIEYSDRLEEIKELAEGYGYTFVLEDHEVCGKQFSIMDGENRYGRNNVLTFVSVPFGLIATKGDFEWFGRLVGYNCDSWASPKTKFTDADAMFKFARDFIEHYHTVKDLTNHAHDEMEAYVQKD